MRRSVWCGGLAAAVVVGLGACGGSSADSAGAPSRDAWEPLRVQGTDMEWFDSVEDMADASDVVVVGKIAEFAPGRSFEIPDPAAGPVQFLDVTIEVDEVLSGELPAGETVVVEFAPPLLSAEEDPYDMDELNALVDQGELVLFLRDKGTSIGGVEPLPEEEGLLRLVNSYALVTETDEAPADVPLVEEAEVDELEGYETLEVSDDVAEFTGHVRDHLQDR
jgi:hypothetical protein